jgi:hypothetical protein
MQYALLTKQLSALYSLLEAFKPDVAKQEPAMDFFINFL